MGAWGCGITENDDAQDLLLRFEKSIGEGLTAQWAIKNLALRLDLEKGSNEEYMALALLQKAWGVETERLREEKLKNIIADEYDKLDNWKQRKERAAALENFEDYITDYDGFLDSYEPDSWDE